MVIKQSDGVATRVKINALYNLDLKFKSTLSSSGK